MLSSPNAKSYTPLMSYLVPCDGQSHAVVVIIVYIYPAGVTQVSSIMVNLYRVDCCRTE